MSLLLEHGPAGSAAAAECARQGLKTLCIEEHGTIGYPVQCAGLLSTAAFEECRVSEQSVLNRVSGAKIISGAGTELRIDAKKTKALVVDRGILDREMAEAAARCRRGFPRENPGVCDQGQPRLHPGGVRSRGVRVQGPDCCRRSPQHDRPPPGYGTGPDLSRRYPGRPAGHLRSAACGDLSRCIPGILRLVDPHRAREDPGGPLRCHQMSLNGSGHFSDDLAPSSTHLVTGTLPLGLMPTDLWRPHALCRGCSGFCQTHLRRRHLYRGPLSPACSRGSSRSLQHGNIHRCVPCSYETRWRKDFGHELDAGYRSFHSGRN